MVIVQSELNVSLQFSVAVDFTHGPLIIELAKRCSLI